ncbi:hypothetical protein PV325_003503 [Microctonus aethiopoides]|nr:hypothetical protein PV325_003503 [Microctonus aethiopoides]
MAFVKCSIFIVLISLTIFETVHAAAIKKQNTVQQYYNADKIVGRWFLVGVLSNYRAPDVPECITVDINKERNNIFNYTININITNSNNLKFNGTAQIVNSRILLIINSAVKEEITLDIKDYENDNEFVVHDHERSVYLILSRDSSDISSELDSKYKFMALKNGFLYTNLKKIITANKLESN